MSVKAPVIACVLGVVLCLTGSVRAQSDPIIAAAGDIACDSSDPHFNNDLGTSGACAQVRTGNAVASDHSIIRVLGLGDYQYYCGDLSDYTASYNTSWGPLVSITSPAAGNHEYITGADPYGGTCPSTNTTAANYFSYFGSNANPIGTTGWYSFDLGTWHIIALNSECGPAGGCGTKSPEYSWLATDLASTQQACIMAYWHEPMFTGETNNNTKTNNFWNLLYQNHADVILNGHVHNYQRFAKLNPSAAADPAGTREIIVGTGGVGGESFSTAAVPQPEVAMKAIGYLRMVLHASSYDAALVKYDGTVLDSFSDVCNQ